MVHLPVTTVATLVVTHVALRREGLAAAWLWASEHVHLVVDAHVNGKV